MANPEFMVYNTMNRKKESFRPKVQGKVDMYVCGVTAYDLSHLGHARAAVAFDYLYRYLQYSGFEVTYVRNFTDVDDKIIRRANEGGEDPLALSSRYCQKYLEDMADLNCLLPTQQPRVSDHMDDIIAMITQIIKNGRAYEVEGDVYFAVDTFPDYGKLSGRKLEDNRAGERVAIDSRKKNPADFALWKRAKPDEPSWESPWGPGRPGWHIECSAMSAHFLTSTFDIHGGGIDLIFPHHENEIAQSCAACQESKVSYWMHNGHVTNNNEKMSKSVGNFFTIREITEQYHPLALRYFLSTTHYRSQINYSISQLEFASEAVFYIYQTLQDCEDAILPLEENIPKGAGGNKKPVRITPAAQECISKLRSEFKSKMDDDLMTPPILNAVLLEPLKFINSSLKTLKKKKQKQQEVESLKEIVKEVKLLMNVLGLLAVKEVKQDLDSGLVSALKFSEVLQQLKDKALKRAQMTEADVLGLIEERDAARKNKEFAKGDQIRSDLTLKGISLMDEGKETTWRPCVPTEHQQSTATA